MIPSANITAWRERAPWPTDVQVEQDLVLSRALVEMFGESELAQSLAFRGGTALHKLALRPPLRYSEDIDLVQVESGPIGPLIDLIRAVLDPWLGTPRRKLGPSVATLLYRYEATGLVQTARLKIEINTREHFAVLGYRKRDLKIENPWFSGSARLVTFAVEELLATKLRALFQRRKGRDLFDLATALKALKLEEQDIVGCFQQYLREDNLIVSRAMFEENLAAKMEVADFLEDVRPLLGPAVDYDPAEAATLVSERLVQRIPGAPWKGTEG